jgi:hypothetical protein
VQLPRKRWSGMLSDLINRRLELLLQKPKLSAIMAALFVCLTIPVLIFILVYSYQRNAEAINATLRDQVTKTRQASIETTEGMINGVAGTLRLRQFRRRVSPGGDADRR